MRNRAQLLLALFAGVFLLAILLATAMLTLSPATATTRGPLLLTIFIGTLLIGFLCIVFLLRWLLRPYRQLVGEAERAPVAARKSDARNEAEFVLETFQTVVAQLQAQQRELERLNALAGERAASAEQFSERIVASVPSGLIAFDTSGRATVVNGPARELVQANGKAEGQPLRELLKHAPDLAEMVERCLDTGQLYRREEITTTSEKGLQRRLGATVAPINPTPERNAQGALCLLTDITEVTNLREQVALKRNLESLGEMSAGLAHEFKNALATLHGYAQLMQTLTDDERGRAAAASLLQEVRSLTEMVTSFLNFARPQTLELVDVSLKEIIEECSVELQPLYERRRVSLRLEGEFAEVRADQRMLRQALLNLMRNAAEAINEDKTERSVNLRGSSERDQSGKEWAVIEIKDTGEGIPAGDLQRVFIPFFTTKSKGHGVGLALAHRVITEHGGTLTASNSNEGGAVFTLRLPLF
ncbi:MAG: ATP-binding protein [Pyrinomonadaceae bacterium]